SDSWLVETAGGVKLEPVESSDGWVTLAQFGATPGSDNALAEENTYALQRVAAWAVAKNRLNLKIVDDFVVGYQKVNPSPASNQKYYVYEPMLEAIGDYSGDVVIDFAGGSLTLADGLKFGSFDPLTGERYDPPSMPFLNSSYRADIGYTIR